MERNEELTQMVERLNAAAALLEQAAERLSERQSSFAMDAEASIGRIVATVEARHEAELEEKLAAAESKIAELEAAAASVPATVTNGRKTLSASTTTLLAKQGVSLDSIEAGALDAALTSLSMEQRFAVKAQLLQAGILS